MMIKRLLVMMIVAMIVLGLAPLAGAEAYTFEGIHAGLTLPDKVYQTVLTPANLEANAAFIQSKGGTVADWQADFAARGILLQAYDTTENRVLVVTALADVDGQQLFDINEHDSATRAKYRVAHGASGAYAVLGYRYDSVSWRNFPKVGRFLQLRYSYREGGEVVRRGYQRRTIRNGHTITVDLQVFGRQLTGRDNTALNRVFDTFTFSQVLPVPPLPLTLEETATAPVETGDASFTMRGKTKPGASLRAVLISFGSSASQVFETTANRAGNYSLPIQLPGEDVYVMTLTVQSPGFDDISRSYNIRYQQGLLPAQIAAEPPMELLEDTFTLAGSTTQSGVRATLSVNGRETSANVGRNGQFSFEIDTSQEGAYDIRLVLSKRGLQDRVFQYKVQRALSPQAREALLMQGALSPTYAQLLADPDAYDGKLLRLEGTLVDKQNLTDTWVLRLALTHQEESFSDLVVLTSETDPGLMVNTPVRVYGTMTGMNISQDEQGNEEALPKLTLSLISAQ